MDLDRALPALCPHCESTGTTGEPCQQPICARWSYHCIPHEYVEGRQTRPSIVGKLIDREFLVVDSIGEGGMGEVYLALQLPLLRRVAIKLVKGGQSQRAIEKFHGEARAMAHLRHPNIVSLIKYGSFDGRPYYAMEYVANGRTLKDILNERLKAGRVLEPAEATHIISQMFDGLEAAHQLNLIHRDIKLENVLLESVPGNSRLVRILDFGLAKDVGDSDQTSVVSGTPIYMAPEQFLGRQLGPWTDVYALGVMMFVMVSGRNPLPVKSNTELKTVKSSDKYEEILEGELAYLSPPMRGFFRRALSRDVAGRFKNIPETREGWRRACEGLQPLPVSATPALVDLDAESVISLGAQRTAVLSPRTSDPWQGTVLLDSSSPDTGTPSAAQPVSEVPQASRRGPLLTAIGLGAAAVVGLVVWAAVGGSSSSSSSPGSLESANAHAASKVGADTIEALPPDEVAASAQAGAEVEPDVVGDGTTAVRESEVDVVEVDTLASQPEPPKLRIETTPAGALVSLGDKRCETPCELPIEPGSVVEVTLAGYATKKVELSDALLATADATLTIVLQKDVKPVAKTHRPARPKPKPQPAVKPKPKIDYDRF